MNASITYWRKLLVPCRHGVAFRSTRGNGSLVVDSNLEGYAVLVPSLAGASAAIPTGMIPGHVDKP
jgi:hypothetical protein